MKKYIVSAPTARVISAYAEWRKLGEDSQRTVMDDGWTLPSLKFAHLYEAHAAALDLAMVSGSLQPMQPHEIVITEFLADPAQALR